MANVRRLLENDLGLDKFTLDAHKSILNPLVDEVRDMRLYTITGVSLYLTEKCHF